MEPQPVETLDKRTSYRARLELPANLHIPGAKAPLAVIVRDLSAHGAAVETDFRQALPREGDVLELALPTRPEPITLQATILRAQVKPRHVAPAVQLLHMTFPHVTTGEQDSIVSFLNQLRALAHQQRLVQAPVDIDVTTGPRAFAAFSGHTTIARPDYITLHMDTFDHIQGADVSVRLYTPDRGTFVEFEAFVAAVAATQDGFDAGIEVPALSMTHEHQQHKVMSFLRQNYPETPEEEAAAATQPIVVPARTQEEREAHPLLPPTLSRRAAERSRFPRGVTPKPIDMPIEKRAREAQRHALEKALEQGKGAAPLRSV